MISHKMYAAFFAALSVATIKSMEKEDFTRNVGIGALAGAVEVSSNQGLITIKNRAQQSQPFTLNPKILYKGYGVNVACMVPATAIQVGFNKGLKTFIPEDTVIANVSRAFCAGAISAVAASPSELVVIAQQNNKTSALGAIKYLYTQAGPKVFSRGMIPTAMRDGGFTVGYSTLYPIVFNMLHNNIVDTSDKNNTGVNFALKAGAGAVTGVITAAMTHPADTIKTVMQSDHTQREYKTIAHAVKTFYKKHGIKGFAKGFEARATRAAIAIPVIYGVTEYMSKANKNNTENHK